MAVGFIGNRTIRLFGGMEIDPTLSHKEMLKKATDIAEQCGYLVSDGRIGKTMLLTIYDNDDTRYFRLQYERDLSDHDPLTRAALAFATFPPYYLTKIEEWRRGRVWTK
uniref:Uncharacterized protein n=1 Tax=viral metagenome TaxID=1070528 RepID=A0A6M3X7L6_9ZZZZ